MGEPELRWQQRLQNFSRALEQLREAVTLAGQRPLSNLERQGLVKAFEFSHELAWNVLKDFFEHQGTVGIMGSRDATREAYQKGLLSDGDLWMEMIKSRNQSAHTYNDSTAKAIAEKIVAEYYDALAQLARTMNERKAKA